jgi:hypothetical protein
MTGMQPHPGHYPQTQPYPPSYAPQGAPAYAASQGAGFPQAPAHAVAGPSNPAAAPSPEAPARKRRVWPYIVILLVLVSAAAAVWLFRFGGLSLLRGA